MAAIPSDKDRLFPDLSGSFAAPVTPFAEDPRLVRGEELSVREALMGDHHPPGMVPMRLAAEVIGTAPGGADLPVYVRVTQSDGHQAWSSPIYLIG